MLLLNPFLLLLIGLFSIHLLTKWLRKNSSSSDKRVLPPSPPRLPILGNLHQLSEFSHRSMQSLGAGMGPLMLLHFGSKPMVIVQSADAASEIMKKHDLAFADKAYTRTIRRMFYDLKDIATAPYSEYWRKLKSMIILQLLSNRRVQSFKFIREEEAALLMKEIESCCACGLPVNLTQLFDTVTNNVICRAAFGRKYGVGLHSKRFLTLLRELLHLSGSFCIGEYIPWLSWIHRVNGFDARVDKTVREVDEFLELVIQDHLDGGVESDGDKSRQSFVDILIDIYKDNSPGASIHRDNIKAILLDTLAGGTDTTSATLEWAMTEILRHPTILTKLQNEVREILKDRDGITVDDLEKMQYLQAVIKETLRLHPPIPISGRIAREDVRVMGYDIAAGTMVIINAWAIGRDPASWDEPEKFHPDRFLNSCVDFKGHNFELIPFGAGRRGCPGTGFATATVQLVLANLVQKFEWKLGEGSRLEDLDIDEQPGMAIHRKHPLLAVATRI
uniref:Cytochrome P450 CYP71AU43 n=1 Tax=Plectranthus barbatus TaxID=41228 RepID=A0A1B0VRP9_9LAMI|nr:cytochrome P450 CYP71AU43 [Plectranthus barbatus]